MAWWHSMQLLSNQNFKNSFYDGMLAHMFATLTGGVFLTGFALYLGMSAFMIGLLAALPFLVTPFQVIVSYVIRKKGRRKTVAYFGAAAARTIWIAVLFVAIVPLSSLLAKQCIVLSLIFLCHACGSISYVAWLSWTSDLVPDEMRGRFFGTRNMLCGIAGIIVMLAFGNFLDVLNARFQDGMTVGFVIIFLSAVLFGILSLKFLNRISECEVEHEVDDRPLRGYLFLPLQERGFRKFLIYGFFWSFSVYFASPFFTLYFLRDLKFGYGFVATLAMLSSFADLIGMQVWGKISDQVKNKAVIQVASWVAVFIPFAWATVRPGSIVIPILLHIMGGSFWAGINLCTNNLALSISPRQNRAFFLSAQNIFSGLGAAISPILAGVFLKSLGSFEFQLFSWKVIPLHVIFLISSLLRLLSLQFFRYVHEPEEVTVGEMVRILRGVRGLNTANGFSYPLHPFLEAAKRGRAPRQTHDLQREAVFEGHRTPESLL
jgi:MFS family permease